MMHDPIGMIRLHRWRRAVTSSPDHPDRVVHHRLRATPRGAGTRAVTEGPLILRHEELPVLLARVDRSPDDLRRSGLVPADLHRSHRRDPVARPARGAPAAG